MSKTRKEKINSINERIAQLENQRKQELQKQKSEERKARDRRLYKRAALLESLLPDTIELTDEQFVTLLHKTIANDYGQDKLAKIMADMADSNSKSPANLPTEQPATNATVTPNATEPPQNNKPTNTSKSAEIQNPNIAGGNDANSQSLKFTTATASNNATNPQSSKPNTLSGNPANPQSSKPIAATANPANPSVVAKSGA